MKIRNFQLLTSIIVLYVTDFYYLTRFNSTNVIFIYKQNYASKLIKLYKNHP